MKTRVVIMNAELHCHTVYSGCGNINFKEMAREIRRKNIDTIVITDHNTIEGYLAFKKMKPDFNLVCGEEISTTKGHILGLFLTKKIPPNLSPEETIDRIKEQGGIAVSSHPYDLLRKGLGDRIKGLKLDAIEVFNSRCVDRLANSKASDIATFLKLPKVTGSDAHFPDELGTSFVVYKDDLYKELKEGRISIHTRYTPFHKSVKYFLTNRFRLITKTKRM